MTVTLHDQEDRITLEELVRKESNAKQRDRYRAVLLALDDLQGDHIARQIGRSPRFVDEWLARYRKGGMAAMKPRKQPGKKPKLKREQEAQLKARLDAGPREEDRVCALRGKDIVRIIEQEFGVVHTLGGIYDVLRRLGYSTLKPRPRHPKNDPQAMEQFQQSAPLLSRT
jgi:transposase